MNKKVLNNLFVTFLDFRRRVGIDKCENSVFLSY